MSETVLFVTQLMPHYRDLVYRHIQQKCPVPARWITGKNTYDGEIRQVDPTSYPSTEYVRNVWLGPFLWQVGLLGSLRRARPAVVVFTGDVHFVTTWLAAAWLRYFTSTRVLYWTMGWRVPEKGLKRRVRNTFYRLADELLLYGNIGKLAGLKSGYPEDRMWIVYNASGGEGVKGSHAYPMRELPKRSARVLTVGAVARLNESKRFDLLVEAVAQLSEWGFPARILIGGEGPERSNISAKAAKLGVECHLVGEVYGHQNLERVYDLMDVTVVPGAIGLTAIQSLQYGTPVITNDRLEIQGPEVEAVTPEVGSLIPLLDARGLAVELRKWWLGEKRADPDDCRRMYVSTWSAEASGDRILTAIGRALQQRRSYLSRSRGRFGLRK